MQPWERVLIRQLARTEPRVAEALGILADIYADGERAYREVHRGSLCDRDPVLPVPGAGRADMPVGRE